jgi:hypothetical protein
MIFREQESRSITIASKAHHEEAQQMKGRTFPRICEQYELNELGYCRVFVLLRKRCKALFLHIKHFSEKRKMDLFIP